MFLPLRWAMPIGWIGGKYSTSKPMSRTYGNFRMTSSKLP